MKSKTYLTNCLTNYGNAAQYDAEAKKIMADKGDLLLLQERDRAKGQGV